MTTCVNNKCGPGYASPLEAMKGPKEELIYIVCIQPNPYETRKYDYLATVDVNPDSPTYCQVIHRTHTTHIGDELHHSGWNICSSCYKKCPKGQSDVKRDKLILPCLGSDRIYIMDVGKNPKKPRIHKVIEPYEMHNFNCATPHTTHCLATGELMISTMGDCQGNAKGDFILIDLNSLKVKETWTKGSKKAAFGYDFWYQPYWDIMVSTEWGIPKVFKKGFIPGPAGVKTYGTSLNFFSWNQRKLIQTIDLGEDGMCPLEVRFLHDPKQTQGFVGCCVNANIYRFYRKSDASYDIQKVVSVPAKKVENWHGGEKMNGMMSDILLSLDDKYLYCSLWLHGDVRQYDISDPTDPKLTGQVFLAGSILKGSKVTVIEDEELTYQPEPVYIKNQRLYGGPQMLQLSLDGKRLYVSSSLFASWDKHFYPEMVEQGSFMVKLDIDTENGGMKLDENFLVNFKNEPDGPVFAHEMRYPGGDCTSDIWLAD